MTEPRARVRNKGQVFSASDLGDFLYAFGDHTRTPQSPASLPSTITCLDEILTDFIIETCHAAALSASYSRRQKIKVDDFKWVLRKDERMLGRTLEQMWKERYMKEKRKMDGFEDVRGGEGMEALENIAEVGGVKGSEMKERKRRRKRKRENGDSGPGRGGKRMAT